MANDHQACACGCEGHAAFPANPATALNYHFGMLLGVDDLRAEQAFHTGRQQRHQRELHGAGVIRGMDVRFDAVSGEVRVLPGMAVDALGREVEITKPQCVNLAGWLIDNIPKKPALQGAENATGVSLDVTISAGACFERPVQAIAAECNGSEAELAYSRLTEMAQIAFAPSPTNLPAIVADPLEILFNQLVDGTFVPAADDQNQASLKTLFDEARGTDDTVKLRAFVSQLALVASLIDPPPVPDISFEDIHLTLARIDGVKLVKNADGSSRAEVGSIKVDMRPLLMPTRRLQTMLSGQLLGKLHAVVIGPSVVSAERTGADIAITFDRGVAPASLTDSAFAILSLGSGGLSPVLFSRNVIGPAAAPTGVTLTMTGPPTGPLRLVVQGEGQNAIVDTALLALGQRPGEDGRNFAATL